MSVKHDLQRSIQWILKHNHDGSFETRGARRKILLQIASQLVDGGYKIRTANLLKQKHIRYLNGLWQTQKLSVGTIKNRNSHLRWLCEKLGKANLMPHKNKDLGVGKRQYITNQNRAVDVKDIDLDKFTSRHTVVQIHLQQYLGLRREEAIKFKPHLADKGTYIEMQPSWCKGGRGRVIPIIFEKEARYWINEAKKLAPNLEDSLIQKDKKFIEQRKLYDNQNERAGVKHPHGFRHTYAQNRYFQITGWECPKQGGILQSDLAKEQKKLDKMARLIISQELGHARIQITTIYLGK